MAKLEVDDIAVEIIFLGYYREWVEYIFSVTHKKVPLFKNNVGVDSGRKSIYKRRGFYASDHLQDRLIPTLEKVLATGETVIWEPMEPDITIEIRPWSRLGWKDRAKGVVKIEDDEIKPRDKEEMNNNFEMTFVFDLTPYFNACGPALRINVSREKLEQLVDELKADYDEFLEVNRVKARGILPGGQSRDAGLIEHPPDKDTPGFISGPVD